MLRKIKNKIYQITIFGGTIIVECFCLTTPVFAAFNDLFNGKGDIPDIPQTDTNIAAEGGDTIMGDPTSVQNSGLHGGTVAFLNQITTILIALELIWLLVSFVIFAVHLSQHGDNPMLKHQTMHNMYKNLEAIAFLGGITGIAKTAFVIFR